MPASFDFRPLLAATVLFLLLIGVFEAAVRWPARPAAGALPAVESITEVDSGRVVEADTTARVVPSNVADEPLPCPADPIRFVGSGPAGPRVEELHRYVGTIGGQPGTVLLRWPASGGTISGSFYQHRGGSMYILSQQDGTHRQPVLQVLSHHDWAADKQGAWRLTARPGAELRGVWHDSAGRHPIVLRENYAGAVRADVHTLRLEGGRPIRINADACVTGSYYYDYLQFPRPRAVAPALRQRIGASPAVVRRRLRAIYNESRWQELGIAEFLLNDFHLLGYQVKRGSAFILDGGKGDSWTEFYLYDLTTGRELTLLSQLRPDYERPLRQLIQRQLLHDPQFDFINREHENRWNWQDSTGRVTGLVKLPEIDQRYNENGHTTQMVLTGSGLEVTLAAAGLYEDREPGVREHTIEIPYRELRPLVRPGTPLARMLRARGIW